MKTRAEDLFMFRPFALSLNALMVKFIIIFMLVVQCRSGYAILLRRTL